MSESQHQTVLLDEAVTALVTRPDGFYVDGTFGRGGHSRLILERLSPAGRLLGIDKDWAAVAAAEEKFADDERFAIAQGSFADLSQLVTQRGMNGQLAGDRKSTRLNSSHVAISYAVFCLKKKTTRPHHRALRTLLLSSALSPVSPLHPATTALDTLSLHDALPISSGHR